MASLLACYFPSHPGVGNGRVWCFIPLGIWFCKSFSDKIIDNQDIIVSWLMPRLKTGDIVEIFVPQWCIKCTRSEELLITYHCIVHFLCYYAISYCQCRLIVGWLLRLVPQC